MNFVLRHWHGQLSVTKAVWLSGFIAWLVTMPVGYLELQNLLAANHAAGVSDLIDRALNGELPSVSEPPLALQAFDLILNNLMFVWWSVGTWRSCDNPVHKTAKSQWFLKLTIVVMATFDLYDFYDFGGKLLH